MAPVHQVSCILNVVFGIIALVGFCVCVAGVNKGWMHAGSEEDFGILAATIGGTKLAYSDSDYGFGGIYFPISKKCSGSNNNRNSGTNDFQSGECLQSSIRGVGIFVLILLIVNLLLSLITIALGVLGFVAEDTLSPGLSVLGGVLLIIYSVISLCCGLIVIIWFFQQLNIAGSGSLNGGYAMAFAFLEFPVCLTGGILSCVFAKKENNK